MDGICAIVPLTQNGFRPSVIGMGILLSAREVITCAHVIDDALGNAWFQLPGEGIVRICFPFDIGSPCINGIVDKKRWCPSGHPEAGSLTDISVVHLIANAPASARHAILGSHRLGSVVQVYGFPRIDCENGQYESHPDGEAVEGRVVIDLPGGWAQITGLSITGGALEKGYSGAGVFDPELNAVVGMVSQADRDKERKIGQFIGTASLQKALKADGLQRPIDNLAEGTAVPEFLPDDRIVKVFVGRTQDVEGVLVTVRKQRIGQKSRPKPGTSLFWYHGFGGMGKSWLLRRLAYLSGKPTKGAQSRPAVLMVDWNPNDRWSPLTAKVSNPQGVFLGVAIRATQVYGYDLLQPFWDANRRFELRVDDWANLRFVRFQGALRALTTWFTGTALPEQSDADILTVRLNSDQDIRDGDILKEVLKQRKLWPDESKDLPKSLKFIHGHGPSQDEVFTEWAELIVSPTLIDRLLVVRPLAYLADVLRECLRRAAETRPLLLLLDTCEELDEWTEYWLRRLLAPLLSSAAPIVTVVGTRSRPDRYLRPGERGGWLDQLSERISPIPFDRGRYLQVTEIEKLLKLSKTSVKGVDSSILADHLHRVTRGIPYALGLLMGPQNSDLLTEVAEWDNVAGEELSASKAARKVNEELAARYLLHVRDKNDREDIFVLALIPGVEEDFEDDREWHFRIRFFNRGASLYSSGTGSLRDLVLASLWGVDWAARLMDLERDCGLVADGDLHPIIRHVLRTRWRRSFQEGMPAIVGRLISALDNLRPPHNAYDQYWVTWSSWRIGFESWLPDAKTGDSLRRAAAVGLAHGLNIAELAQLQYELGKSVDNYSLSINELISEWEDVKGSGQWSPFEHACLELVRGLAKAETNSSTEDQDLQIEVAKLLAPAIEFLWPGLPDTQQKRITEVYLRAVSKVTIDRQRPEILEEAVTLSQRLPLYPGGVWWGYILHNQGRYEESCTALRAVLDAEPSNEDAFLVLFHNLAHHLKNRHDEALAVLEQWLKVEPFAPLRRLAQRGAILRTLKRYEEGISELNSALISSGEHSDIFESKESRALCHTELGMLNLDAGHLEEAEVELRKAIDLHPSAEVYFALGDLFQKTGKATDSIAYYDLALGSLAKGSEEWFEVANKVAWRRYLQRSNLAEAERLAVQSLQGANSVETLQTLFAIQARAGRWEASDSHFRRYLREYPIAQIVSERWAEHILFFRDVLAAGKQRWASNRIAAELPAPRDSRWEIIRLALTDEPVEDEELRPHVENVALQLRSDQLTPLFPTVP